LTLPAFRDIDVFEADVLLAMKPECFHLIAWHDGAGL